MDIAALRRELLETVVFSATNERHRLALLAKPDAVLLAVVACCREHPSWTADEVHLSLAPLHPGLRYQTVRDLRRVLGEWTDNRITRGLATRHTGYGADDSHARTAPLASVWEPPVASLAQEPEHIRREALRQWRKLRHDDAGEL
jgi:hypothetical protein